LPQIIEYDVLDLDVDKRKPRIPDIARDNVVLAFLVDHRALNVAVQEIERVYLVPLNREPVAVEVELDHRDR